MAIISGQQAKLQVGVQSNWSTAVAPTLGVEFTQEGLNFVPNYLSSDALTGRITVDRMDPAGSKVEGSFSMICNPDNVGLLLSATLGAEAAAADQGSSVYDHVLTPISASVSSSLPKMTIVVDRLAATKGYVGCKVDSAELSAATNDYLRATFNVRGYDEIADSTESLTLSNKRPYQFVDGTIEIDGSTMIDVRSFSMTYSNNLENDRYTMDGTDKMREIEPQARSIEMSIEADYTSDTETIRSSFFKSGASAVFSAVFESTETIASSAENYTLTIACPAVYVTEFNPTVSGPERISASMTLMATQPSSGEAITITLRDGSSSKYIT